MNKNILFLLQGPSRSIYFESFVFELQKKGYNVTIGSMCPPGLIQEYFREKGFTCINYNSTRNHLLFYYLKHFLFWTKVIKKYKIKTVYSHLQWANSVALLLGTFSFKKLNIIPTRHHVDASFLHNSKKRKIEDYLINLLAKKQVVVSKHAKDFMVQNEWFAKESKIYFIPLGYDFNLYKGLESNKNEIIKNENRTKFLLLLAARLIKTKRHELVLDTMQILINRGLDIKLLILDDGPEKPNLIEKTKELKLEAHVKFMGHQLNISDYMIASDLIMHPSIEESSNQVVKEAAYYKKTAVVTKNIGDFNEYILDKKNAFFIEKETTPHELADLVEEIYLNKYDINQMAAELRSAVISRFDIIFTTSEYIKLSN